MLCTTGHCASRVAMDLRPPAIEERIFAATGGFLASRFSYTTGPFHVCWRNIWGRVGHQTGVRFRIDWYSYTHPLPAHQKYS